MSDFDTHIARYEMGVAYRAITAALGPCPQLTAFINYDKVTKDSLGLESFNIMEQHAAILAEIDGDPALAMATESLIGRIKSVGEKIKNFITRDDHDENLTAFTKGKLTERKSNIYVEPNSAFSKLTVIHDKAITFLAWFVANLPKDSTPAHWETFTAKHVRLPGTTQWARNHEVVKVMRRNLNVVSDTKTVDFAQSGWSDASFKSGITKYNSEVKRSSQNLSFANKLLPQMEDYIGDEVKPVETRTVSEKRDGTRDENGRENVVRKEVTTRARRTDNVMVLRGMNAALSALFDAVVLVERTQAAIHRTLRHVASHYQTDAKGLESLELLDFDTLTKLEEGRNMHIATEGLLSVLWGKKIPLHSEFAMYEKFHAHTISYIKSVLSKVPSKPDLKAWESFKKHVSDTEEKYFDELAEVGMLIKGVNGKSLEEAGWTKANYQAAVQWTEKALQSSSEVVELWKEKSKSTEKMLADAGEDKAKIDAIFKSTFHQMYGMDATGAGSAHQAEALLKRLAPEMKETEKK